jgi:hypothetical protein
VTGNDDRTARLWDAATGKPLGRPLPHPQTVAAVAFSPDGRTLLTRSQDGTARLWNATSVRPLGPPLQHQGAVLAVAFSPDGKTALTGSADRTARRWPVPVLVEGTPERILLWAQVLTGMELDDQGAVRALAAETWEAGSKQLEAQGGPPLAAKTSLRAWHEYEAEDDEQARRWFSARWHLDRLLAAEPDNATLRSRRARAAAELGE